MPLYDRTKPTTRREVLPRESLIVFVLGSPGIALLLVRGAIEGGWFDRARIVTGIFGITLFIAIALYATFEGLLSFLPIVAQKHPSRFLAYAAAAGVVVVASTFVSAPILGWIGLDSHHSRHGIQTGVVVFVYLVATFVFKRLSERIATERSQTLAAQAAAVDARYRALQARTNPHFLFNALNSVITLIGRDPTKAEEMVSRLATLLRYSLEGMDRPNVSLAEELDAVRSYVEIERVRFRDRLRVRFEIDGAVDLELRVPPMVLQPLVENAVLHGIGRSVAGGTIDICVAHCDEGISLSVDDDCVAPGPSRHAGTGTSLANLSERLLIATGGSSKLVAGRRPDGGFRTQIILSERDRA